MHSEHYKVHIFFMSQFKWVHSFMLNINVNDKHILSSSRNESNKSKMCSNSF